jgi:hypothetical protein
MIQSGSFDLNGLLAILAEGVILTPTLLKLAPAPVRRIIGNLSERRPVLLALQLPG